MKYRLVTTWRDDENDGSPIMRAGCDFATEEDAEIHVRTVVAARVTRFDPHAEPMENGVRLKATYVPIERIIGWFVWELPDDWPMIEGFRPSEDAP